MDKIFTLADQSFLVVHMLTSSDVRVVEQLWFVRYEALHKDDGRQTVLRFGQRTK